MFLRKKSGQSTLEYVILTGFVVAALIAMGIYMKRGFQGRLKESTDQVGQQYSPGITISNYTTVANSAQIETLSGGITSTNIDTNLQNRWGNEHVMESSNEYWGN
ncbi:MAG: hypothetical protein NTW13_04970 [Candidatus Omnitrophica bacterium]|nr:hypothetical protein [Candidatus Omnitrophota bacterium]